VCLKPFYSSAFTDNVRRTADDALLPSDFHVPVAVAEHLLNPAALTALNPAEEKETEESTVQPEPSQESVASVSFHQLEYFTI
jgi:hypothetical protein